MVVHTPRFDCFSVFESPNIGTRKVHIEELNATGHKVRKAASRSGNCSLQAGRQSSVLFPLLGFDKISLDYAEPCRRVDGVSGGWCCPGLQRSGQRILN